MSWLDLKKKNKPNIFPVLHVASILFTPPYFLNAYNQRFHQKFFSELKQHVVKTRDFNIL